jgi:hypothetical protein
MEMRGTTFIDRAIRYITKYFSDAGGSDKKKKGEMVLSSEPPLCLRDF